MANFANRLTLISVLVLLAATTLPAQVSLISTPNPSMLSQSITLTASVTTFDVAGPPSVGFYDGATLLGSSPVIGSTATFMTSLLTPGTHTLRARYNGAASPPLRQDVIAQPSYAWKAPVFFPGAGTPSAIAAADFNGDGRPDVATATANGVYILTADSTGAFQPAGNYPLPNSGLYAIFAGDFDGDGIQDLVAGGFGGVFFLKGMGNGSFAAPASIVSTSTFIALAVGDFNGDGIMDVAVDCSSASGPLVGLRILLGNTSGSFTNQINYPSVLAASLAVADFNEDGIPDLAVSGSSFLVVGIMIGVGDGTFAAPVTYDLGWGTLATADLNSDGHADLIIRRLTGTIENSFTVLLGNGNGSFRAPIAVHWSTTEPSNDFGDVRATVVTDVNGDGKPDVVIGSAGVLVFLGTGDGTFTTNSPIVYGIAGDANGVAAADWNGDGAVDLAFTSSNLGYTANGLGILTSFSSPRAGLSVAVNHNATVLGSGVVAYTITVSNSGSVDPSVGPVMVAETRAGGFSMSGDGWSCSDRVCRRVDTLNPGASYPPITALMSSATSEFGPLVFANVVSVTGGNSLPARGTDTFQIPPLTPSLFPPGPAGDPVTPAYQLNWIGSGGEFFDVFLGASFPPSQVASNFVGNHYNPGTLAPCTTYYWKVIGKSGGVNVSSTTATFATLPSITLSQDVAIFPSSGGSGSVDVTAQGSCAWNSTADPNIVTITDGATGSGNGTVRFTVAPYGGAGSRSAFIGIGDKRLTVLQDGSDQPSRCVTTISGPAFIDSVAQSAGFVVTTDRSCDWMLQSASSPPGWLTLPVSLDVPFISFSENTTGASRSAVLAAYPSVAAFVAHSFTVTQRAAPLAFTDVPLPHQFFDAIGLLRQRNITGGCSSAPLKYCPDDNVTRGQMAVLIVRSIMGGDNFTYSSTPYFNDTPTSHPFFKWAQKMWELGITGGCGTAAYCPDSPVTRGQMAVFIIRARLGATATFSYPGEALFNDIGGNPFFFWIQKMGQLGITAGCGGGQYCPDAPVTRAQMALFVMRGAFNQLLASTRPIVVSVSPNVASAGQTVSVTITGQNTYFNGGAAQVSAGPGITVSNIGVSGATSITAQFRVAPDAAPGPRSVTVTIPGEIEATLPNGFKVQ